jgi:hypothetical protein
LADLANATFFHRYYGAARQTDDKMVLQAGCSLLDPLTRVGFVSQLGMLVPLLQTLLAMKNELTGSAIAVLATLPRSRRSRRR